MALSDSKVVHEAALRAKVACEQILATDAALQQLKADWIADGATPFANWKASGNGPDGDSLIPPDFDVRINALVTAHNDMTTAMIAHLNFLKGVE